MTRDLFELSMNVAVTAIRADPTLQLYVECVEGGWLLCNSNGCVGPFEKNDCDPKMQMYVLEIRQPALQ
jgi:hypothetical protein